MIIIIKNLFDMKKLYINVTSTLCVLADDDASVDNIMDNIDITAVSNSENADVEYIETEIFYLQDAK